MSAHSRSVRSRNGRGLQGKGPRQQLQPQRQQRRQQRRRGCWRFHAPPRRRRGAQRRLCRPRRRPAAAASRRKSRCPGRRSPGADRRPVRRHQQRRRQQALQWHHHKGSRLPRSSCRRKSSRVATQRQPQQASPRSQQVLRPGPAMSGPASRRSPARAAASAGTAAPAAGWVVRRPAPHQQQQRLQGGVKAGRAGRALQALPAPCHPRPPGQSQELLWLPRRRTQGPRRGHTRPQGSTHTLRPACRCQAPAAGGPAAQQAQQAQHPPSRPQPRQQLAMRACCPLCQGCPLLWPLARQARDPGACRAHRLSCLCLAQPQHLRRERAGLCCRPTSSRRCSRCLLRRRWLPPSLAKGLAWNPRGKAAPAPSSS